MLVIAAAVVSKAPSMMLMKRYTFAASSSQSSLRNALLRAIDAEMTGPATLPTEEEVARSVGDPGEAG